MRVMYELLSVMFIKKISIFLRTLQNRINPNIITEIAV
jgi:hypothetical protein